MLNDPLTMERNTVEDSVAGLTLVDVLARNAQRFPDRPAIRWGAQSGASSMTWLEYRTQVLDVAAALIASGIEPGDTVAIMVANRPEHVLSDLGAIHARATPVTVYSTFSPSQVAYVAGNCSAKVAIVEDAHAAALWESIRSQLPSLKQIVIVNGEADGALTWKQFVSSGRAGSAANRASLEELAKGVAPNHLATLIYTSGTTGEPKGVELTHANVLWALESMSLAVDLPDHPRLVSYLPLAHIAERVASHYLGIWLVGEVTYCSNVASIMSVLKTARPHLFVGVPRIWEKVYQRVTTKLAAEQDVRRRRLAEAAVASGSENLTTEQTGGRSHVSRRLKLAALDRIVLSKIRTELGFDQLRLAITTAGPIDPNIVSFFRSVGVPLHELFGMTECCGPATTNLGGYDKIGTVGRALPGVEVRTLADGELMIRGGNVMAGYFRNPDATREAVTDDGWLHTGDLASIDRQGYVTIVGRKKELIVTSGGKNIAPVHLEHLVQRHPLVAHVCVVGDRRPYLVAVVALDGEEVEARFGPTDGRPSEAPEVKAAIAGAVAEANAEVARVEQLKKFVIVDEPWTPESGLLTPSFKLKRSVVHARYGDLIERLYG